MRALSVRQPFACAILDGSKTIEYRSWPTKHRGCLLIHASGTRSSRDLYEEFGISWDAPRGVILGKVELVDCIEEGCDWHWVLKDPKFLVTPVPFKARLRLFDVPLANLGEFVAK